MGQNKSRPLDPAAATPHLTPGKRGRGRRWGKRKGYSLSSSLEAGLNCTNTSTAHLLAYSRTDLHTADSFRSCVGPDRRAVDTKSGGGQILEADHSTRPSGQPDTDQGAERDLQSGTDWNLRTVIAVPDCRPSQEIHIVPPPSLHPPPARQEEPLASQGRVHGSRAVQPFTLNSNLPSKHIRSGDALVNYLLKLQSRLG